MKKLFLFLTIATLLAQSNHLGTLTLGNKLRWDDPNTNRLDVTGYRLYFSSLTGTVFALEQTVHIDTNQIWGWQLTNWLRPGLKQISASTLVGHEVEGPRSGLVYLTYDPSQAIPPANFRIITEYRTTTVITNSP